MQINGKLITRFNVVNGANNDMCTTYKEAMGKIQSNVKSGYIAFISYGKLVVVKKIMNHKIIW